MRSKRMVSVLIRNGKRSSFFTYLVPITSNPSLYHALIVIFLEFFAWGLLTIPVINVLKKTFPDNTFLMNGIIFGIKGFLSFLTAPLLGCMSDMYGRKFFLLFTVFFTCLPIPFLQIWPLLHYALIAVSGLFAVTFSIVFAYVADITSESERSFAYGAVSASFALSMVVSPALGSYLSDVYSDDLVTALATLVSLVDVFFILFMVPESLPEKLRLKSISFWESADPFSSLRRATKDSTIFTLCIVVFLSYLPEAGQYSCFFVYLKLVIGFSKIKISSFIAMVGIMSVVAQTILLSLIIRKFGSKNTIMLGLIFEMLQLICYGLGTQAWIIWGAGLIAALASITYPAISAYVSNYADEDKQGLVQGIITGVRCLCTGLGPAVFGLVFSFFDVDLDHQNDVSYLEKSKSLSGANNMTNLNMFNKMFNSSKVILDLHNTQMVPGPPFLCGALLVLLAILVTAFIPELIQYPATDRGAHHPEASYSGGAMIKSGASRVIMTPSRSNNQASYYYKNMHHMANQDTACGEDGGNFDSSETGFFKSLNGDDNCKDKTVTSSTEDEADEKEKLLFNAYKTSKFASKDMVERRRLNSSEDEKVEFGVYHQSNAKPLDMKS